MKCIWKTECDGDELIVGKNWTESRKKHGLYRCVACDRARAAISRAVDLRACDILGVPRTTGGGSQYLAVDKTTRRAAREQAKRELEARDDVQASKGYTPWKTIASPERADTTAEQDDYERKLAVIREQEAGNTKQLDDTPTTRELYVVINDGSHTNRIKPGVTRNFNVRKMMTGQTLDPDWKPRVVHRVWLLNITKAQATALEDKVFERMGNQGYTRVPHATTGNASEWLAWPHFSEDQAVKDAQRYMNAIAKEWNDVHTHSGPRSEQPTAGAD